MFHLQHLWVRFGTFVRFTRTLYSSGPVKNSSYISVNYPFLYQGTRWVEKLGNRIRLIWHLKCQNWPSFLLENVFHIALIWFKTAFLLADFELYARYVFTSCECFFYIYFFQWMSTKPNIDSVTPSRDVVVIAAAIAVDTVVAS